MFNDDKQPFRKQCCNHEHDNRKLTDKYQIVSTENNTNKTRNYINESNTLQLNKLNHLLSK